MSEFGPFEKVHVENEWCDGPRAGLADIQDVPHRFQSLFDERDDEYSLTFQVWPISLVELALEIEQWCIFVEWNVLYEAGQVDTESHPGHGGRSPRWDEIETRLQRSRQTVPLNARHATAQFKHSNQEQRYATTGPSYEMCWKFE